MAARPSVPDGWPVGSPGRWATPEVPAEARAPPACPLRLAHLLCFHSSCQNVPPPQRLRLNCGRRRQQSLRSVPRGACPAKGSEGWAVGRTPPELPTRRAFPVQGSSLQGGPRAGGWTLSGRIRAPLRGTGPFGKERASVQQAARPRPFPQQPSITGDSARQGRGRKGPEGAQKCSPRSHIPGPAGSPHPTEAP